jgi:hypothetical protein
MFMSRSSVQFLFILFLSCSFGFNAIRLVQGHYAAFSQAQALEQVLEIDDDAEDETDGPGGDEDHEPATGWFRPLFTNTLAHCASYPAASIRQSHLNFVNSFQAPAFFILFNSYQGYLS